MRLNKKGVFQNLVPIVIGLVILGIVMVVGFLINSNVAANSQVAADANATNAIRLTTQSMEDIPPWIPILVIVLIGALIIAVVSRFGR